MWMIIMLVGIGIFVGSMAFDQHKQVFVQDANYELALAQNMLVYRNYVIAYAAINTGVTGVVPDANLAMPAWFRKAGGVSNYVVTGKGYVVYVTSNESIAYTLLKQTNNSINVGINQSGTLYNSLTGVTGIPIPAAIQNNAIVIAQ